MLELDEIELDEDMFLLDETTTTKSKKVKLARVKRHKPVKYVKYKYAQELVKDIGNIEENEAVFAVVSGNFIAGDVIESYLVDNDLYAEEILISTLSYSKDNVDSLKNIVCDGRVKKMGFIVSDYFFSHERANGIKYIIDELGDSNFTLAAAGIHTKMALIKTTCGKYIVIHGSANLRSSRCMEQLIFENNQELYNFNRSWMVDLLNRYYAKHESLRGDKLWQVVAAEKKG